MTLDSVLKWTVAMAIGVQHSQGSEFRSSPDKLIAKKSRNEQAAAESNLFYFIFEPAMNRMTAAARTSWFTGGSTSAGFLIHRI